MIKETGIAVIIHPTIARVPRYIYERLLFAQPYTSKNKQNEPKISLVAPLPFVSAIRDYFGFKSSAGTLLKSRTITDNFHLYVKLLLI